MKYISLLLAIALTAQAAPITVEERGFGLGSLVSGIGDIVDHIGSVSSILSELEPQMQAMASQVSAAPSATPSVQAVKDRALLGRDPKVSLSGFGSIVNDLTSIIGTLGPMLDEMQSGSPASATDSASATATSGAVAKREPKFSLGSIGSVVNDLTSLVSGLGPLLDNMASSATDSASAAATSGAVSKREPKFSLGSLGSVANDLTSLVSGLGPLLDSMASSASSSTGGSSTSSAATSAAPASASATATTQTKREAEPKFSLSDIGGLVNDFTSLVGTLAPMLDTMDASSGTAAATTASTVQKRGIASGIVDALGGLVGAAKKIPGLDTVVNDIPSFLNGLGGSSSASSGAAQTPAPAVTSAASASASATSATATSDAADAAATGTGGSTTDTTTNARRAFEKRGIFGDVFEGLFDGLSDLAPAIGGDSSSAAATAAAPQPSGTGAAAAVVGGVDTREVEF